MMSGSLLRALAAEDLFQHGGHRARGHELGIDAKRGNQVTACTHKVRVGRPRPASEQRVLATFNR
jgi:hypothetical protein